LLLNKAFGSVAGLGWFLWIMNFVAIFVNMVTLWFVCLVGALIIWSVDKRTVVYNRPLAFLGLLFLIIFAWVFLVTVNGGFFF